MNMPHWISLFSTKQDTNTVQEWIEDWARRNKKHPRENYYRLLIESLYDPRGIPVRSTWNPCTIHVESLYDPRGLLILVDFHVDIHAIIFNWPLNIFAPTGYRPCTRMEPQEWIYLLSAARALLQHHDVPPTLYETVWRSLHRVLSPHDVPYAGPRCHEGDLGARAGRCLFYLQPTLLRITTARQPMDSIRMKRGGVLKT
ncbi:unnamed protein product [Trichogramma brassicae]|uniref:Uncharacterized protein n=1 Tax=Trichogramma brassicae TaxID=86971 RepID=A0A6H5J0Y8_9HYME|nr:unnamed protein product [Trichogramma brassicae]